MSKKDIDKAAISAVTGEMPQQFQNFVEQQSRVSSKKEAKANVGKENQVSISIPLEWDDGLAELCREIREGHPEYNRFSVHCSGQYLTKRSIIKTLVEEYLRQHKKV